ncbi:segregation and condensation protein B [Thermoplasmatales archaeon]|nr:segregation and condensation protein B [Thermoplasmatales archaeon]
MIMNPRLMVEAVLYASNKPLSIRDISGVLSLPVSDVSKEMKKLIREYGDREISMTIVKIGKRYRMQLKEEYLDTVNAVSEPELTGLELSVMGFIASHPSCRKGDLREKFGEKYHLPLETLKAKKLVHGSKYRNTEILTTGKRFFDYFGIDRSRFGNMVKDVLEDHAGDKIND